MHQSVAESEYVLISTHTMHLFSVAALEKIFEVKNAFATSYEWPNNDSTRLQNLSSRAPATEQRLQAQITNM